MSMTCPKILRERRVVFGAQYCVAIITLYARTPPVAGIHLGPLLPSRRPTFLAVRMRSDDGYGRSVAIVIGSGDVGSAIAVALHRAGCGVVICDVVDPAWTRRGMAFTNAWYIGNAELDGEGAVFCASLKSIPAVLDRHRLIAATTWSWAGVAGPLRPIAVIDATVRPRTEGSIFKSGGAEEALLMIVGARNDDPDVDVFVDPHVGTLEPRGVVHATRSGRFATRRRIGVQVREGEEIAAVGALPILAPCAGVLRGLSAHGARVTEGAEIVEVDPRGDPVLCFGIESPAWAVGRDVLMALAIRGLAPNANEDGAYRSPLPRASERYFDGTSD
jgi:xanthine dehydrogenase accessory factor